MYTFTRGPHTVKLSIANSSGCWSDVLVKIFSVDKDFPQLEFANLNPICITDNPLQLVVKEKLNLRPLTNEFSGKGVSKSGLFDPVLAGVGKHVITYKFVSIEGCEDTIEQEIEVYALTKINVEPIVYILTGGQKVIAANIENFYSAYNYKYKWTPSIGLSKDNIINPIAFPDVDTEYTLTISIDGLCDVSTKVNVKVLDQVKPPSAFSPNGDGTNDVWVINSLIPTLQLL